MSRTDVLNLPYLASSLVLGGHLAQRPDPRDSERLGGPMRYVCDAPGNLTWFRLESLAEAEAEAAAMQHAVDKFFRNARLQAMESFRPASDRFIEQEIGLAAHIARSMPYFLTLRDEDGASVVTAMVSQPSGDCSRKAIIVGFRNADPYSDFADAILALGQHLGRPLERDTCYPYR
jgi:hypothetical protein